MTSFRRQIVAMGGGGFSMEIHNPLLDQFILSLTGKSQPRVCFVGTASGDADSYVEKFYRAFRKHPCEPSHLSLFRGHTPDVEGFLLSQDVIYVGGGNTRNMLTLWREWGVDRFLRTAYERGTVMAGVSAGSLCWFKEGVTDSVPGTLSALSCLGWLPLSHSPHYDGEPERRPSYHRLLREGKLGPGIAADDSAGLYFVDEQFQECVVSHPEKRGYHVRLGPNGVEETPIPGRYLGGKSLLVRRSALADAEPTHRAHMHSIQTLCAKDYSAEQIQAWGHRAYREDLRREAIQKDRVWVVEKDGVIEGYSHLRVFADQNPKTAKLLGLYLTPEVVGRGLGRALVELALEQCREEGIPRITADATRTASAFYAHLGFSPSGPEESTPIAGVPIPSLPMGRAV